MTGEDNSQDVFCGSPSTGFLSAGLPVRSKTYQRPSPLRQRLQNPGNKLSSKSKSSSKHIQLRSRPTAEVPDTSVAVSRDNVSGDAVSSTSQTYERLRPGEIRLFRLLPSESFTESIAGSLATFMRGASPNYTAISYAWGDRKKIENICVDGKATPVTSSLWHALMALRRRDEPIWIWADVLSINQRDLDELNSQVHIMDKIYSEADTVAICLGPQSDRDDIELAFGLLWDSAAEWKDATTLRAIATANQQRISSVVRLFERNYWKRLWVMQEVFHAKRAEVYCGSDSIPLTTIFAACRAFQNFSHDIEHYFPADKVTQSLESHYSHAQMLTTQGPNTLLRCFKGLPHDPLEVLRISRSKLTARPQDKILGVLSFLPRSIRLMFQPDFHLTTQEVFTDIVVCVIKSSRSLDIICESIRFPFHQNSFGLPSWVPDWSHSPDTLSLAATHLSHRRPFQASPTEITLDLSAKSLIFSGDELRISGTQVGTITARGMAVGTLGRLSDYLMAFLEWRHLLHDDQHYTQSHTVAFCRTLCLGDVPKDAYGALYFKYGLTLSPENLAEEDYRDPQLRQMDQWQRVTFDLFAQFLGERLGRLPLDEELQSHLKKGRWFWRGRQLLQDYFGDRMMGRCFCLIEGENDNRYMGMGTGYMGVDDLVVIADGCSTPIIIRPTNQEGKYEFIGDIYVDGCMDGDETIHRTSSEKKEFVLC